ncbi:Protein CBG27090 [Caenorhabditis briggsae]|uniref:Protein CBG27090 n=1 Tax=Caenorhabditis briggsae TaxID=6238 RepID=B6IHG6_CAEBR|nr:Protein CBG27090 [Caenorhabditis briggsae]CAR99346.1 Protein CBG27090 [Caenorhabditis briggsae]
MLLAKLLFSFFYTPVQESISVKLPKNKNSQVIKPPAYHYFLQSEYGSDIEAESLNSTQTVETQTHFLFATLSHRCPKERA